MLQSNDSSGDDPIAESSSGLDTPRDLLTEILRAGAQKMLAAAIDQKSPAMLPRDRGWWMKVAIGRWFATGFCPNVRS